MDCIYCNSADDGGCISWRLYPNDFTDELFLLWLIGLGVLLVAGIYVAECNKYRY